jgi:hypothetical protein
MTLMRLVVGTMGVAVALATGAQPVAGQAPTASGQFAIYKLQHRVGAETWSRTTEPGRPDVLTTNWLFTYIGSTVRLTETLTRAADGHPIGYAAKGGTSTLTDVDLDVSLAGADGRIVERGRERSAAIRANAFPIHMYPPAAIEEALFAWWVAKGKPTQLALVPSGDVRFEHRGTAALLGQRLALGPPIALGRCVQSRHRDDQRRRGGRSHGGGPNRIRGQPRLVRCEQRP